ncbi:MAG: efflux transporter periplasmic adaptor subunit, partial [Opitutales bacterium]
SALASDDYESARLALKSMGDVSGHKGETAERIHRMLAAKTIESIRRPHFELLSNTMIAAVRADPGAFEKPLYLNHCSMVYPDRGADWLQSDGELRNPYWGAAMLHCGNTKEVFEK